MSGHQNYINLGTKPYEKGLLDLGNNSYAYLQPDGVGDGVMQVLFAMEINL